MMNLNEYIVRNALTLRSSRKPQRARRPVSEDVGGVSVTRSPGLDSASIALPANINLDDRAVRMNKFWKALVEFQYRDVLVVAICADIES
jgi:hypothetical protein